MIRMILLLSVPGKSSCPWRRWGFLADDFAWFTVYYFVIFYTIKPNPFPTKRQETASGFRGRHMTGSASLCPSRTSPRALGFLSRRERPVSTEAALCWAAASVLYPLPPRPCVEKWCCPRFQQRPGLSWSQPRRELKTQSLLAVRSVCPELGWASFTFTYRALPGG